MAKGQPYYVAGKEALGIAYGQMVRQASTMSFVDCFWLLGVTMLVLIPVVFIMRRTVRHHEAPPGAH